ncbi:MAG: K+/H+ antiporter subunit F [Steroidobacteraceae bacterium]
MAGLIDMAAWFASGCFGVAMCFATWRVIRGPAAQDRVLGLDTLYVNAMAMLLAYGIRVGSGVWFEIALLIALFGFVGSVALAKFLLRGEVIEP